MTYFNELLEKETEAPEISVEEQIAAFQYKEVKNAYIYAQKCQSNQAVQQMYESRSNKDSMDTAVADFLNPPEIVGILSEKYKNNPNFPLIVLAKDDFWVHKVWVKVLDADQKVLEAGWAKQYFQNLKWFYFVSPDASKYIYQVEACAYDLPGNEVRFKQVL
ncbi:MAG: hypothetical protein ACNS62_04970 [Candidatus Cyclobacteriaceae bacterium M3_2C_046]